MCKIKLNSAVETQGIAKQPSVNSKRRLDAFVCRELHSWSGIRSEGCFWVGPGGWGGGVMGELTHIHWVTAPISLPVRQKLQRKKGLERGGAFRNKGRVPRLHPHLQAQHSSLCAPATRLSHSPSAHPCQPVPLSFFVFVYFLYFYWAFTGKSHSRQPGYNGHLAEFHFS